METERPGIVVPMRQNSVRLGQKHLYELLPGVTLMELLARRLTGAVPMRLAIPHTDFLYIAKAKAIGADFRCGDERDHFGLIREAASGFDPVVVVFGDSPLVEFRFVAKMLDEFKLRKLDVLSNTGPSGARVHVLAQRWLEEVDAMRRELAIDPMKHLARLRALQAFAVGECTLDPSDVKLSVDTFDDMRFVQGLVQQLGGDACVEAFIDAARAAVDRSANVRASELD